MNNGYVFRMNDFYTTLGRLYYCDAITSWHYSFVGHQWMWFGPSSSRYRTDHRILKELENHSKLIEIRIIFE